MANRMLTLNIAVTIDADDLVDVVGHETAERYVRKLLNDQVKDIEDILHQTVQDVSTTRGCKVPVAVREVKLVDSQDSTSWVLR